MGSRPLGKGESISRNIVCGPVQTAHNGGDSLSQGKLSTRMLGTDDIRFCLALKSSPLPVCVSSVSARWLSGSSEGAGVSDEAEKGEDGERGPRTKRLMINQTLNALISAMK